MIFRANSSARYAARSFSSSLAWVDRLRGSHYVHMPGGTLEVEIKEDGMVYMVGEVGYVGHIQLGNELSEQLRIK